MNFVDLKLNQSLMIGDVRLVVIRLLKERTHLGIKAPEDVLVLRGEMRGRVRPHKPPRERMRRRR